MPFKLQASSTLLIKPCYDGQELPDTYKVAGEGLALLSIKDHHCNCTFICDSGSKLPCLSCAQGIKPRNSFRNLHKPDLRKIRGLENPTTENIIQMFQTHNVESYSLKSFTKKMISKLSSALSKKSKTENQPLVQHTSWPINFCVLSSICQETEMVTPVVLRIEDMHNNQDFINEKTIMNEDFEDVNSKMLTIEDNETVFITLPPSNMHANTSDDLIPASELLDPSNGDSSTKTTLPLNTGIPNTFFENKDSCEATKAPQVMSSSILLENKQSQHQISIPSDIELCEFRKQELVKESNDPWVDRRNTLIAAKKSQLEKEKTDSVGSFICNDNGTTATEGPSSIVVQSIFADIFEDMEEVKDAISSYMTSFYVHEEEYDNFPALHKQSKDVASHFFQQIHGLLKDKNCISETVPSTLESDIKGDAEKEATSCCCYWDDNDLGIDKLSQKELDCNISQNYTNEALVPFEFIENMWKDFTDQVETHAIFLDLVNENETKKFESHDRNYPSYGHWANMYDPSIFEEAENIVHTIDSLFMTGCFPADEGNNATYIPATIVELVEDREFSSRFEERPNKNGNKPVNKDENILTEKENDTMPHKKDRSNDFDYFTEKEPPVETSNRRKIHEIKLEPVFNQETMHEIDYSREAEYEKINLNHISHQGRVSFSSLHSDCSNSDLPTAVKNTKHYKEELIDYHILFEEKPPKYLHKGNCPNKVLLRNDSKDKLTQDKFDDKSVLLNKLDEDSKVSGSPMFERMPEKHNPGNTNPAFLFSSSTVQIDLTNPFIDKKIK